jgi:hypothetical protein
MKSHEKVRSEAIKYMFAFSRLIEKRIEKISNDDLHLFYCMAESRATKLRNEISRRAGNV